MLEHFVFKLLIVSRQLKVFNLESRKTRKGAVMVTSVYSDNTEMTLKWGINQEAVACSVFNVLTMFWCALCVIRVQLPHQMNLMVLCIVLVLVIPHKIRNVLLKLRSDDLHVQNFTTLYSFHALMLILEQSKQVFYFAHHIILGCAKCTIHGPICLNKTVSTVKTHPYVFYHISSSFKINHLGSFLCSVQYLSKSFSIDTACALLFLQRKNQYMFEVVTFACCYFQSVVKFWVFQWNMETLPCF